MINIAIVGSRGWIDFDRIQDEFFDYVFLNFPSTINVREEITIVSGGAKGADTLAEQLAKFYEIPFIKVVPNYSVYGSPTAQFIRNEEIVKMSDVILAFSLGTPGTKHTISVAKKLGKPVKVFTL